MTTMARNRAIDHTGKRFGRLVVLYYEGPTTRKWVCQCDCGGTARTKASSLLSGDTVSCGCYFRERQIYRRCKRIYKSDDERWADYASAEGEGCWEWKGPRSNGYGVFNTGGKALRATRIAFEKAYGPSDRSMFICHKCDNPACIRPDHLFLGTAADNNADKIAKRRANGPSGSRNIKAKLTEKDVLEIRSRLSAGAAATSVAEEFGVSRGAIYAIQTKHSWRHI